MPIFKYSSIAIIVALLSACGGGGGGSSTAQPQPAQPSQPTQKPTAQLAGVAIDGYLRNARVCLDVNDNLVCDSADGAIVLTDEQGRYTLPVNEEEAKEHNIIVQAVANQTIDMDTPDTPISSSFTYMSEAKNGAVVSPISTMVTSVAAEKNITIAEAEKQVSVSIGISSDVFNSDFVASTEVEAQQVHALARGLTQVLQESNKALGRNKDQARLNSLLTDLDLPDLKRITDDSLNDRADKSAEIDNVVGKLITNAAINGELLSSGSSTIESQELTEQYNTYTQELADLNQNMNRLDSLYHDLTQWEGYLQEAIERYNFCKNQGCSRLATYFDNIVGNQEVIDQTRTEITALESQLKAEETKLNERYVDLVIGFSGANSVNKIQEISNGKKAIDPRFVSLKSRSLPAVLDADNDGIPDSVDAFPNNPLEFADNNANKLGDHAESVTQAFNKFTIDFYKSVAAAPENQNSSLVISPLSIAETLSMVLAGAQENTALELGNSLSLTKEDTISDSDKITYYSSVDVLKKIKSMNNYLTAEKIGDSTIFTMANAFWLSETLNVKSDYQKRLTDYFDSSVQTQDFSDAATVVKNVNAWTSKNTGGEIDNILNEGDITSYTRAILANAVYFKGTWTTSFEESDTEVGNFYTSKNGQLSQVQMPLMKQTERFKYTTTDLGDVPVKVLEMEYGSGNYSMVLLQPNLDKESYENGDDLSLTAIETALSGDTLQALLANIEKAHKRTVDVTLPKFKTESETDAKAILSTLGIQDLFDARANLSGISAESLYIDKVKHKAIIEVEEKGTTAAAVTVATALGRTISITYDFKADRPFIYLIRDKNMGNVLFLGKFTG